MNISGTTRIFTILAHPSTHVVAPMVFNHLFSRLDLDMAYIAHDVTSAAIPTTLHAFADWENLGGFNVTIPHKEQVADRLEARCPISSRIGAVNTVVRTEDGSFYGYNTDGIGALHALGDVKDRRCLVIGNGGAARAIIDALLHGRAAEINILGRSPERVAELLTADIIQPYHHDRLEEMDVVVQATPLADSIPFGLDPARLPKDSRILETVMRPTALATAARQRDLRVIPGHAMLYHQTRMNFRLFTGMDLADDLLAEAFARVGYRSR